MKEFVDEKISLRPTRREPSEEVLPSGIKETSLQFVFDEARSASTISRRRRALETIAVQAVKLHALKGHYLPTSVETHEMGYDLILANLKLENIAVEVKGYAVSKKAATVELSRSEIAALKTNGNESGLRLLALVKVDIKKGETEIHLLENPDLGGPLGASEVKRSYLVRELIRGAQLVNLKDGEMETQPPPPMLPPPQ